MPMYESPPWECPPNGHSVPPKRRISLGAGQGFGKHL